MKMLSDLPGWLIYEKLVLYYTLCELDLPIRSIYYKK